MNNILALEHYAGKVLSNISLNGLFLDSEYLRNLMTQWELKRKEAAYGFFKNRSQDILPEQYYGVLNSPKQLSQLLYGDMKMKRPPKEVSDSQYRTDADSIEFLRNTYPDLAMNIFSDLLAYRKFTKLQTTYGAGLIARVLNNFIYPNVNIGDAETGRTTSNNPNIQNIPAVVRPAFCSRFVNGLLKGIDLSQIELRVAAFVSRDTYMMEAFRTGRDFHTETAVRMFKLQYDKVTEEQRRVAKIINFGVLYLAGPGRIADEAGCSYQEAKAFIELYFETFWGLKAWIDRTLNTATDYKMVVSPLGRIRRVPFADRRTSEGMKQCREAVNAVIQGMASDIALIFASLMYRNLRKWQVMASMMVPAWVHDFFMVDCNNVEEMIVNQDIQTSLNQIKPFMQSKFGVDFDVPLAADIKTGYRWDAKENPKVKISNLS